MSENKDLPLEIWTEMAQQQPKLEDMGKYIKKNCGMGSDLE